MNTTEEGVRYFIDHKNKVTTFQDPRDPSNQANNPNGVKSFRWKYGQFRYLCQSNAMNQVFDRFKLTPALSGFEILNIEARIIHIFLIRGPCYKNVIYRDYLYLFSNEKLEIKV